jgi:hypothetical protein
MRTIRRNKLYGSEGFKKNMNVKDARIYWNGETKEFRIENGIGPLAKDSFRFPCWLSANQGGKTIQKQVLSLITEAIWLVEKEGFDLTATLKELRKISEIEKAFREDPYSRF